MAKVGLSKPFYAIYTAENNSVAYQNGGSMGKAVEAEIEPDDNDTAVFYADNGPAESANMFSGGTLTLSVDRLDSGVVAAILGITPGSSTTPSGTTLDFSAENTIPYVGVGLIAKSIVDGSAVWMGIVLTKVQFKMPTLDLDTQGEEIEFTANELEATILRDDTTNHNWMKWGYFTTEGDAETWIKGRLSISAATT